MISPCVDVLRRLAASMNSTLGAQQGTKHTTPSLERDIAHLRASLRRFRVYEVIPGREIDDGSDNPVVPDSLTLGLQRLGEPLKEFNAVFAKLQARCRAPPLLGHKYVRDNIAAPARARVHRKPSRRHSMIHNQRPHTKAMRTMMPRAAKKRSRIRSRMSRMMSRMT